MSNININLIVNNAFDLHAAIAKADKKTIDVKIHDIANQIGILNPDLKNDIINLYTKEDVSDIPIIVNSTGEQGFPAYILNMLEKMEQDIFAIVSKALPSIDLTSKVNQQQLLAKVLLDVEKSKHTTELEKVLKQGIDLNAVCPILKVKGASWLSAVLNMNFGAGLRMDILRLFLQHGAQITEENKIALINFVVYTHHFSPADDFLELLISRGFDLNTDGAEIPRWSQNAHRNLNVLFFGADIPGYNMYHADFSLRDDALREMNRSLPPSEQLTLSNMTLVQRRKLAQRCHVMQAFREMWQHPYFAMYPMTERIKLHEEFIASCHKNDFEQAGKLLKEGSIDINAALIQNDGDQYEPLLVHACKQGNVKLVEWLLQAGANPNTYGVLSGEKTAYSLPPILTAALNSDPNSDAIMDLLQKAGADINIKEREGCPLIFYKGFMGAILHASYSDSFDPAALLRKLIAHGYDPRTKHEGRYIWTNINMPQDHAMEWYKALVFYGCLMSSAECNSTDPWYVFLTREAIKLRDEVLANIAKEGLLQEDALKKLSADLIGVISAYHSYSLEAFTPQQRLQLADLCYEKAKLMPALCKAKESSIQNPE